MRNFLLLFCALFSCANADLYNSSDPVTILTNNNIYETILDSKNAWIVQFYNSWCGHCINFAPKWREFSKEIADWSHTIKSAVIDCSDEDNVPTCRDYEVMSYPSIRFFGAFTKKGDTGSKIINAAPNVMLQYVINLLIQKEMENSGSDSWVNLIPYNDTLKEFFKKSPQSAKHGVVIVEDDDSNIGSHSILDLGNYPMVYARRMCSNHKEIISMNLKSYPSVMIIKRDGKSQVLTETVTTREELTALIMHELKLLKKITEMNTINSADKVKKVPEKEEEEGAGDGKPEEINSDRLNYDDDFPDSAYSSEETQVFMVDMENAISYALRHEVMLHKVFTGETLRALRDFLKVLVKYFPARPQVHEFLSKLENFVSQKGETITEENYEKALKFLTSSSSILPDQQPWKGCLGSVSKYRGYPCGMWTLFHTITVNAFIIQENENYYDPLEPLRGIHGYVKHFFSCDYCSEHFQEMYGTDAEASVKAPGDEVMWLWRGHNKVNKRLKNDFSEDPSHPKEQFPPKKTCSVCWKGDFFDEAAVLQFLTKTYNRNSLSLEGAQEFSTADYDQKGRNRQAKVFDSVADSFQKGKDVKESNISMKKINTFWGINSTDINLCVVLYIFSTLIIFAGYMMFILKRKLRRKKFFELYKRT